jgi:hypothetical protein
VCVLVANWRRSQDCLVAKWRRLHNCDEIMRFDLLSNVSCSGVVQSGVVDIRQRQATRHSCECPWHEKNICVPERARTEISSDGITAAAPTNLFARHARYT